MRSQAILAFVCSTCLLFAVCCLVFLEGCGGSTYQGPSPGPSPVISPTPTPPVSPTPTPITTSRVRIDISWAARSRAVNAPSSALSAVITLQGAGLDGGDFTFSVNRDADPRAYLREYISSGEAKVGTWLMNVRFFGSPDGAGALVGTAQASATLSTSGALSFTITTTGTIQTVEVVGGQSIRVGETRDLAFTARDSAGNVVVVTPGSAFFAVTVETNTRLQINPNGSATALRPNLATVTATVDGITSAPANVVITSDAVVTAAPNPAAVSITGTLTFTATVQLPGQPAPDQAVTWSILDPNGGAITPAGVYTAPAARGTYRVAATSVYDPTKQAVIPVTVQAGTVPIVVR